MRLYALGLLTCCVACTVMPPGQPQPIQPSAAQQANQAADARYRAWLAKDEALQAQQNARATASGDPLGSAATDPLRGHIYPDGSSFAPVGGGDYVPEGD